MVMQWLMQHWMAQLLGVRARLGSPDLGASDRWWLSVRERILAFLVSRYALSPPEQESEAAPLAMPSTTGRSVGAEWTGEKDGDPSGAYPPRRAKELTERLTSVRRVNVAKRARWRWL